MKINLFGMMVQALLSQTGVVVGLAILEEMKIALNTFNGREGN